MFIKITDDIKEVPVQIVALRFSPITRDNNISFQFAKYGSIDIVSDLETSQKYVAMYLSSNISNDELQLCLSKISKIKNLKSIAFPDDIPMKDRYDDYVKSITTFAESNSHIKVYLVSKLIDSKLIDHKILCPYPVENNSYTGEVVGQRPTTSSVSLQETPDPRVRSFLWYPRLVH